VIGRAELIKKRNHHGDTKDTEKKANSFTAEDAEVAERF
jgi:hypothetical protein